MDELSRWSRVSVDLGTWQGIVAIAVATLIGYKIVDVVYRALGGT